MYSGTRLTNTPEEWPSTILQTLCSVPNAFTYVCVQLKPLKCGNPVKQTGSPVPPVPELYKIHAIIWTLVYRFRKIVHHIYYIKVVLHHAQPHTATERSKIALSLCSTARVHITTPTGSIPKTPEIRIPLYYGYTAVVPTVSGLEGLHCI